MDVHPVGWMRAMARYLLALGLLACLGCKPGLHSRNWLHRAKAVERLSDQAQLAAIAVRDEAEPVCLMAVAGLTDRESLAIVAFDSPNSRVQIAAIEKLTDPTILATLAEPGRNVNSRIAAIEKLKDSSILDTIVRRDSDPAIREAVASRLAVLQGIDVAEEY